MTRERRRYPVEPAKKMQDTTLFESLDEGISFRHPRPEREPKVLTMDEQICKHSHVDYKRDRDSVFALPPELQQRLTFEHLDYLRVIKLGVPNRYSRHLGRQPIMPRERHPLQGPTWRSQLKATLVTVSKPQWTTRDHIVRYGGGASERSLYLGLGCRGGPGPSNARRFRPAKQVIGPVPRPAQDFSLSDRYSYLPTPFTLYRGDILASCYQSAIRVKRRTGRKKNQAMQFEHPLVSHKLIDHHAGAGSVFYLSPPDQQRLTWEHLETLRLKKLRIPNRYSRHLGKTITMPREIKPLGGPAWNSSIKPSQEAASKTEEKEKVSSSTNNSIAPFFTAAKPTCGYFFSRGTDNKKRNFGIPPSDLAKWRSFAQ